ncbi:MAG: sigma-70 family RNA polymerase sigma factor [Muribaculaceae bacterium]|nr:sigma-70 family RNA polymerase sigma factor [Muribaculaceae bacterium]
MYRLAVALLHNDDLARDIVHDVFASLLGSTQNTVISGSYLLRAVRNRCLNHIRDCEIHQRIANLYFIGNVEYDSEDWPDEETIARIYDIIKYDLSQQARKIIDLRFNEGMRFAEIAASMGISETAIYRHLSHALIIIRQKLNANEQSVRQP